VASDSADILQVETGFRSAAAALRIRQTKETDPAAAMACAVLSYMPSCRQRNHLRLWLTHRP
jgi:hypothetical protein